MIEYIDVAIYLEKYSRLFWNYRSENVPQAHTRIPKGWTALLDKTLEQLMYFRDCREGDQRFSIKNIYQLYGRLLVHRINATPEQRACLINMSRLSNVVCQKCGQLEMYTTDNYPIYHVGVYFFDPNREVVLCRKCFVSEGGDSAYCK